MMSGSVAGGAVLVVYLAIIAAAAAARRRARGIAARAWLAIAILLGALALEKALHVETLILRFADSAAVTEEWYAQRAGFQTWAIGTLAGAGLAVAALIGWMSRRAGSATRVAALSGVFLAAFVSIRAVSLHRLDRLLGARVGPLRVSNVVELAGLGVIGVCAWAVMRATARNGGG